MSEKIEIEKGQLDAILEDNKGLKNQITSLMEAVQSLTLKQSENSGPKVFKQIKDRKVRVVFVNGKPVIGFVNRGTESRKSYTYEKPDPNDKNNRLLYIDLILQGEKEPISVNYNEFLREGERVECIVKDQEKTPWTIEYGHVRQKAVEEYSMVETDVLVPVEASGYNITFKVEIPKTGEILEINEEFINMIA